jgi:hypothetical protein
MSMKPGNRPPCCVDYARRASPSRWWSAALALSGILAGAMFALQIVGGGSGAAIMYKLLLHGEFSEWKTIIICGWGGLGALGMSWIMIALPRWHAAASGCGSLLLLIAIAAAVVGDRWVEMAALDALPPLGSTLCTLALAIVVFLKARQSQSSQPGFRGHHIMARRKA